MIYFDRETRTFNLNLDHSYYALRIDEDGHPVHIGWGIRPSAAAAEQVIDGRSAAHNYNSPLSFVTQFRPDEILPFGELITHQETLKVGFSSLAQPPASFEAPHTPLRDLRLHYAGYEISTEARPGLAPEHNRPTLNNQPRETLRLLLRDPQQPFAVILCYRLTPEQDIIERWLELENLGQEVINIDVCNFASLLLPAGVNELTSVSGAWSREFQTSRERLPSGTRVMESRTLQTGHAANPFFLLNKPGQAWEESGTVYFGQLAYSGSWRMSFEQLPSWQVRVHGGYNPFDFQLQLAAGEWHVTPAFVCGVCPDGWGGAGRRMHAFTRERVLPGPSPAAAFRPVLYNSWEAVTFDINLDNQVELARQAAAVGVELFCLDDGWFGARRDETAGLGDWSVRQDAFPDGLEALVAEVRCLGMKFGLWVEPEMVNPDSSLYRQHPDWVLHFPGRPRTEARHQLILDFSRAEVVAHILAVLDGVIARYGVDFLKWDMNRYTSEPGSAAGKEIWYRHVAGVYHIMDQLRIRHPKLEIQSCSGGGGRVDLGILGRTEQVWVSDNTDAFARLAIQEGFSLAYPARIMEAWVTAEYNELTRRSAPLTMRFDVAMRGALGIGSDLTALSQEELADYAGYIAFYKRIRHVVQEGRLYRLERLEEYGSSVIAYVLADGSEAVYSLVLAEHAAGSFRPSVPLRGLHAGAIYAIYDRHNEEIGRLSGYHLMTLGPPQEMDEHPGYSRTLHLKQV
jgi:alpha-galactosidase